MRPFIVISSLVTLALACVMIDKLPLLGGPQPANINQAMLSLPGSIALAACGAWSVWLMTFGNTFLNDIKERFLFPSLAIGGIVGLIAFDVVVKTEFSEVWELVGAWFLFCMPIARLVAMFASWFPWRLHRKEVAA